MVGIPAIEPYPMPTADDLPENVAKWRADPARAVLLIHDMQHYFINRLPASGSPRNDLMTNVILLRKFCSEHGMSIAYTAQPGGMTDGQRGLLRDFWGPGMRVEAADREIAAELSPAAGDWIFTKWRYSAFFKSDLLARMRAHGRDQLVICGLYAHVGVLMTALDAFTNDIETFLVADAIADFTKNYHVLATEYAAQRCAVVATTEQTVAQLARRAPAVAPPALGQAVA